MQYPLFLRKKPLHLVTAQIEGKDRQENCAAKFLSGFDGLLRRIE
jgi:hypothetical protein